MNFDGLFIIAGGLYGAVTSRATGRALHGHLGRPKDQSAEALERAFLIGSIVMVVLGFAVFFFG
jgi:hypothetical protein